MLSLYLPSVFILEGYADCWPGLALQEMLAMEGPFLLDIMVPHIQHVLPMIPGGGSFQEVITTGDGLDTY